MRYLEHVALTKCRHCGVPVVTAGDTSYECEACETIRCRCGSGYLSKVARLDRDEVLCVACGACVEVDWSRQAGVSFEGNADLMDVSRRGLRIHHHGGGKHRGRVG